MNSKIFFETNFFVDIFVRLNKQSIFVKIVDNVEAAKNLKPGDVITVKHTGMNAYGKLLYPQFYRERTDVNWTDLNKTEAT